MWRTHRSVGPLGLAWIRTLAVTVSVGAPPSPSNAKPTKPKVSAGKRHHLSAPEPEKPNPCQALADFANHVVFGPNIEGRRIFVLDQLRGTITPECREAVSTASLEELDTRLLPGFRHFFDFSVEKPSALFNDAFRGYLSRLSVCLLAPPAAMEEITTSKALWRILAVRQAFESMDYRKGSVEELAGWSLIDNLTGCLVGLVESQNPSARREVFQFLDSVEYDSIGWDFRYRETEFPGGLPLPSLKFHMDRLDSVPTAVLLSELLQGATRSDRKSRNKLVPILCNPGDWGERDPAIAAACTEFKAQRSREVREFKDRQAYLELVQRDQEPPHHEQTQLKAQGASNLTKGLLWSTIGIGLGAAAIAFDQTHPGLRKNGGWRTAGRAMGTVDGMVIGAPLFGIAGGYLGGLFGDTGFLGGFGEAIVGTMVGLVVGGVGGGFVGSRAAAHPGASRTALFATTGVLMSAGIFFFSWTYYN